MEPWKDETPEEQAARQQAYERLAAAFKRMGLPAERLAQMLHQVAGNEMETRRFLSEQVYGVPDDLLDDMVRVRMADLDAPGGPPE
jgi:hypothetical protein